MTRLLFLHIHSFHKLVHVCVRVLFSLSPHMTLLRTYMSIYTRIASFFLSSNFLWPQYFAIHQHKLSSFIYLTSNKYIKSYGIEDNLEDNMQTMAKEWKQRWKEIMRIIIFCQASNANDVLLHKPICCAFGKAAKKLHFYRERLSHSIGISPIPTVAARQNRSKCDYTFLFT